MVDATPRTPPMTLSFVALDAPPPPYPHDTTYSTIHRPHPVRPNIDLPLSEYRNETSRIVRCTVPPRSLTIDFRSIADTDSTDGDDDTFLFLHNRDAAIFADQGLEQDSSEDDFDAAITAADQGSEHDGILCRGIGSRAAVHRHSLLHSRMDTHQCMEHNHGHGQEQHGSMAPILLDISPYPTYHQEDYIVHQDNGFRLMPRKRFNFYNK